jgi:hypothetical protein
MNTTAIAIAILSAGLVGATATAAPATTAGDRGPRHAAAADASSTATLTLLPATGVKNGGAIKVSGHGFPAKAESVYVVECGPKPSKNTCDTGNVVIGKTTSTGTFGPLTIKVHTGKIGASVCKPGGKCVIAATTDPTGTVPNSSGVGHFTFAASTAPRGATKTTAALSKPLLPVQKPTITGTVSSVRTTGGITGLTTLLEIRHGGKWKKVERLRTGASGKFQSAKLSTSGSYEVRTPKQTKDSRKYLTSHSAVITVTASVAL